MASKQQKHRILSYGASGTGKSSLVVEAMKYVWKTQGKKGRVLLADGGSKGIYSPYDFIEVWDLNQWLPFMSIFDILDKGSKGHWPSDTQEPGSPLLPGLKEWRQCPFCKGDSGSVGLQHAKKCASCQKDFPAGIRLELQLEPINGMEEVGAYAFEGGTAFGQRMLEKLREMDPDPAVKMSDMGFDVKQISRNRYNDAQNYQSQHVANSYRLPVWLNMWTCLEKRGKDRMEGDKPVLGPAWAGNALTDISHQWFEHVIHVESVEQKDDKTGLASLKRQLFLTKHYPKDVAPLAFIAKATFPEGRGPSIMDYVDPKVGNVMEQFFTLYDEAAKAAREGVGK